MFDFSNLRIVKNSNDNFVGIRKDAETGNFSFYLPNGFDNFPEGDFDLTKDFFFRMYRTFRKFEIDNRNSNRLRLNNSDYQQDQDQAGLSAGGVNIQSEEGETCILYSKIKMIEKILEAYDDLAIQSIQKKIQRSEEVDYSQIHKYLDRAIYPDDNTVYIEAMDLPHPVIRYESTDIVNLYCYILDEVIQQLQEDVPNNIQVRLEDICFLSRKFKDSYLTSSQSIFDKDTFVETIAILKDSLDSIDKNIYYKDADYWNIYEAIETFLYGEINPSQMDGDFWGIKGFSLVWEDMCQTYFFCNHFQEICYADTDVTLNGHKNKRASDEIRNVGNHYVYGQSRWLYTRSSNIHRNNTRLSWRELVAIEMDSESRELTVYNGYPQSNNYSPSKDSRNKLCKRFLSPDLVKKVFNNNEMELEIIDFKDVPLDFYLNPPQSPISAKKYRVDLTKQLTYEYALQQTHTVNSSYFFIPYYFSGEESSNCLGEFELRLNIKGVKVFKGNFRYLQNIYINQP